MQQRRVIEELSQRAEKSSKILYESSKPRFNTEKELLQYYNAIPFSEWENKMRDKLGCNSPDVLSEEQRQYFDNSFSQIESDREQEEFIEQCRRELEARVIELRNKKQ